MEGICNKNNEGLGSITGNFFDHLTRNKNDLFLFVL
jgi:hypothetical protein